EERLTVEKLEQGFYRVTARYGFMESPDVPEVLTLARAHGLRARSQDTSFFLGRERIILAEGKRKDSAPPRAGVRRAPEDAPKQLTMARWRKKIFMVMSRNARSATEFFAIPPK